MKSKFHAKNNFQQHRALVRGSDNWLDCCRGYLYRVCIPLSLIILMTLGGYYVFYSSDLYTANTSLSATSEQPISSGKQPSGLYTASKYVTEISSEFQYNQLLNGSSSVIAVYYASWCGHCRAFAPQFTQTSETVTKTLNQLHAHDQNLGNITFIAIDCVQHRGICRNNKVSFYPLVMAHYMYMAGCKSRECTRLQGAKADVLKYLSSTVFKHGELDEKFVYDVKSSDTSVYATLYANNDTMSYHLTPSHTPNTHIQTPLTSTAYLLNDMMASYTYFLYNDLPTNMDTQQAAVLYVLNHILLHTLPQPGAMGGFNKYHLQAYHTLLDRVNEVLYKYSAHTQFPSNKITNALTDPPLIPLPPLTPVSTSHLRQHKRRLAHTQLSSPLKWYVCGVPVHTQTRSHTHRTFTPYPHTDPTKGYTCGLWLFFHYLTFHAPSHTHTLHHGVDAHRGLYGKYHIHIHNLTLSSVGSGDGNSAHTSNTTLAHNNYTITPSMVQGLVYMYVDRYFRCANCRVHFMHYYELNLFKPITMFNARAEDVQVWLLLLHNFINLRILYENVYVLKNQYVHTVKMFTQDDNYGALGNNATIWNISNTANPIDDNSTQVIRQRITRLADAALWPSYSQCPLCYVSDQVAYKSSFCTERREKGNNKLSDYEAAVYAYVRDVFEVEELVKYAEKLYN
ncbi:hypothetical protein EON63_00440 [archaeon]|nr:MAG: hypothetical protein EON63_00440 [archaeon]